MECNSSYRFTGPFFDATENAFNRTFLPGKLLRHRFPYVITVFSTSSPVRSVNKAPRSSLRIGSIHETFSGELREFLTGVDSKAASISDDSVGETAQSDEDMRCLFGCLKIALSILTENYLLIFIGLKILPTDELPILKVNRKQIQWRLFSDVIDRQSAGSSMPIYDHVHWANMMFWWVNHDGSTDS